MRAPRLSRRSVSLLSCLALVVTAPVAHAAGSGAVGRVERALAAPGAEVSAVARLARAQAMLQVDTGEERDPVVPGDDLARACPPDRCRDWNVPVPPGVDITSDRARVILPRGYATSGKRYPVLYFFNGALSSYDQWTKATNVVELASRHEAIFVFPEGGHGHVAGFFSDWHDGSFDWETYHVQVLVPWVDRTFRTQPGARGAVGASMGSIGALGYAARHPGLFQSVLTISGLVDTAQAASNGLPDALTPLAGARGNDLRPIWGDPVLDADVWAEHNPTLLAPRLRGVHLMVASGTGFSSGSDEIRSGRTEYAVWNNHRTFLSSLVAHGVPYEERFHVGGIHTWSWFVDDLSWAVPRMVQVLSQR